MSGAHPAPAAGRALAALLGVVSVAGAARAAPPEPVPRETRSEPPRSYPVEFRAGQVELEGEVEKLELSDDVVVTVDRYRLTSDRLVVTKGPRGVVVEGPGRLALCRCDGAPVQLGFDSALVAPPTDLLIEDPTLRIGGVPVCWLPYFWLRAPNRFGVLPPRIAYRGEEGLLLGSGVHVPLGGSGPEASSIDVSAAGYVQGGVDLGLRVVTPRSTTLLRWDHLDESLVVVDAQGSVDSRSAATLAWDVDAVRGARGRRGTIPLDEAARRYDRLEAELMRVGRNGVLGLGVRADAARGGAYDSFGAFGPDARLGAFTALSGVGSADLGLSARSRALPGGDLSMLFDERAELQLAGRPGPFGVHGEIRQRSELASTEAAAAAATSVGARLRVGLPLARAFDRSRDPVEHWIEPQAEVAAASIAVAEGPLLPRLPEGEVLTLLGGLHTSLGRRAARWAVEVDARAGALLDGERTEGAALGTVRATTAPVGVSVMAGAQGDPRDSHVTTSRLRVGPSEGLHVSGYAHGRSAAEPLSVRTLAVDAWDAPRAGWFDEPGWTTGGALSVPWARWLASSVGGDYDVSSETLLGVRGAVAYRHPCGCLAVIGWAGHRLGRDGVDATLTVDLLP